MSLYGVIGYHVTLSEGHMVANHPYYEETLVPHLVETLLYLSQKYSYYIRGDRSPLIYEDSFPWCMRGSVLPCKGKRQYLLTWKVSSYCLLALHGRVDGLWIVYTDMLDQIICE